MEKESIQILEPRIRTMIRQHLGESWSFRWGRGKRVYGTCYCSSHLIVISKVLAQLNPWEQTRDTVLHEIAHGLAGENHGHDETWRKYCRQIGARPERCYSSKDVVTPLPKYYAVCEHCGKTFTRNRVGRGRRYSCSYCSGGHFNPNYLIHFKLTGTK